MGTTEIETTAIDETITVAQFAKETGRSVGAFYWHINRSNLKPAQKIGNVRLFKRSDLTDILSNLRKTPVAS